MTKVSVIVPVYNVGSYLERCLESLVHQTLEDIEIIVVNDSSPDESHLVIERYQANYPDKIKSFLKPNGGVADTRNYGLLRATGEYIGFVDGDDYVDLTMYEKLYNKAKCSGSQMVSCDFCWVYSDRKVYAKEGPYNNNREYMVNSTAVLWNKIFNREWVQSLDFQFPKNLRYEDTSYLIKSAPYLSSIDHVSEPLVYYVQRQDSITYTQNAKVGDMLTVFYDIFDFYKCHGLEEEYHDELEYLTLKYFLGSSFLRASQIGNKKDRERILNEGWRLLNECFPNWKKNRYLMSKKDKKHLYYKCTNRLFYQMLSRVIYLTKVKLKK